jgi:predicted Co/Zn/Cd cation transporter (cation efflux family)
VKDAGQPPRRATTAMDGAIALIAVLLVVQMWLLTAALEAFLAGHRDTAAPAALISALLFAACAGLYLFIERLDRAAKNPRR